MVQFEEVSTQCQSLVTEAEQLSRDAQAFEQPEPQFTTLHELQVRHVLCASLLHSFFPFSLCLCILLVRNPLP